VGEGTERWSRGFHIRLHPVAKEEIPTEKKREETYEKLSDILLEKPLRLSTIALRQPIM